MTRERLHCQWHLFRFFLILSVFHIRRWLADRKDQKELAQGKPFRHRALRVGRRAGQTIEQVRQIIQTALEPSRAQTNI